MSVEGLLDQTPGTFSQQTLLEALIVTGTSAYCFAEQYRVRRNFQHAHFIPIVGVGKRAVFKEKSERI